MTITKTLDPSAIASATSVAVKQKVQNNAANLRPEVVVCIGQAQTGITAHLNELTLASGNADDIGVMFGFGSPLHRMAKKLFPKNGNGSKVDTYFIGVAAPGTSTAEVKTITVTAATGVKKSLNGYILVNDMTFEAAADVAGKIATNAQLNPAKAPRGTDLNAYEKTAIPFTLIKGMTEEEAAAAIQEVLRESIDLPFLAEVDDNEIELTARWAGSDSAFELAIVDEDTDSNNFVSKKYNVVIGNIFDIIDHDFTINVEEIENDFPY